MSDDRKLIYITGKLDYLISCAIFIKYLGIYGKIFSNI